MYRVRMPVETKNKKRIQPMIACEEAVGGLRSARGSCLLFIVDIMQAFRTKQLYGQQRILVLRHALPHPIDGTSLFQTLLPENVGYFYFLKDSPDPQCDTNRASLICAVFALEQSACREYVVNEKVVYF